MSRINQALSVFNNKKKKEEKRLLIFEAWCWRIQKISQRGHNIMTNEEVFRKTEEQEEVS